MSHTDNHVVEYLDKAEAKKARIESRQTREGNGEREAWHKFEGVAKTAKYDMDLLDRGNKAPDHELYVEEQRGKVLDAHSDAFNKYKPIMVQSKRDRKALKETNRTIETFKHLKKKMK